MKGYCKLGVGVKKRSRLVDRGFVLVVSLLFLLGLLILSLGLMGLARVENKAVASQQAEEIARANARLALMVALGKLQEWAGPDQRVTARAAIFEDPENGIVLANRNWLGVWKTTLSHSGREWPVVGKCADEYRAGAPYPMMGIYSDLRNVDEGLRGGAWRDSMRLGWLVSGAESKIDPRNPLALDMPGVVELVGRGTLGAERFVTDGEYLRDRVLVKVVDVAGAAGLGGGYAYFVSDNSQKSALSGYLAGSVAGSSDIAVADNPIGVRWGRSRPYRGLSRKENAGKLVSYGSLKLAMADRGHGQMAAALAAQYHDFTDESFGLFTDVVYGGFKKDLHPLIFGNPGESRLLLEAPNSELGRFAFSSRYPIIPGNRKVALGPSFAALRSWGMLGEAKNKNAGTTRAAEVGAAASAIWMGVDSEWVYGTSDGRSVSAEQWAERAPKLKPVMTDCRFHFYFSYRDVGGRQRVRTHLIPRVCLWNPYSVPIKTGELLVLMANPLGAQYKHRQTPARPFYFEFSKAEVKRVEGELTKKFKKPVRFKKPRVSLRSTADASGAGLFPEGRFLGFVLEKSELLPGECLVFSPVVRQAKESVAGVGIQEYDARDISRNRLSAEAEQGGDHFIHEYGSDWAEIEGLTAAMRQEALKELDFGQVWRVGPRAQFVDDFPFILKSGDDLVGDVEELRRRSLTLQSMRNGGGGTRAYGFWFYQNFWGWSDASFGNLQLFAEAPRKDAPRLFQFGMKLLWLDEAQTEANSISKVPLRLKAWGNRSLAYHPALVANWNVRPTVIVRSPASPVGRVDGKATWYAHGAGAWLMQFVPKSPQDFNDMPMLDLAGKYFVKPPFGMATQAGFASRVVMFDVPDSEYGALSLAALRHAQLSPYSWHPTYIIGNSLVDLHAPFESSAHPRFEHPYRQGVAHTRWGYYVGGGRNGSPYKHGVRVNSVHYDSLLQIGTEARSVRLDGQDVSSPDEQLAYDICFEVNQNLWDHFFLSSVALTDARDEVKLDAIGRRELRNDRYVVSAAALAELEGLPGNWNRRLEGGFWYHGYLLRNRAAFNVNSTSVAAWTAFLSGMRGVDRAGVVAGSDSLLSRVRRPSGFAETGRDMVSGAAQDGWHGGRRLNDDEVRLLARMMVREVKRRGPFLSLADFINRRLERKGADSICGAVEAAIRAAGLNAGFEESAFLSPHSKRRKRGNNHSDFSTDVDKLPKTKAWGIPGFITQADLLEPLAPAMTVRGDDFTVRCYGEARGKRGEILATAYLEARVRRCAQYIEPVGLGAESLSAGGGNRATDPSLQVDYVTGELIEGRLSALNRKFGRKMKVVSLRWLNSKEI